MKKFNCEWSKKLGKAIDKAQKDPYPMEFHAGKEYVAIALAINQGIDSHLQAVQFDKSQGTAGRTKITIALGSLSVLVRRLLEADTGEALRLATDICYTLEIELI